jgi:2-iminobutanoate/2-iminopropanoate deaminase
MSREAIHAPNAPAAAGPYSHAIVANGFVFTAGQVGMVPATKTLAEGGIQGQTRQALENLQVVLEAAGTSLDRAVKTTVFLANIADFAAMNEVYATFFPSQPPARTTIQAGALPAGALVEIEVVAVL